MSKTWRVVWIIVLIAVLLGAVCVGVGVITGGEWSRIYSILDTRYHVDVYVKYAQQVVQTVWDALTMPVA